MKSGKTLRIVLFALVSQGCVQDVQKFDRAAQRLSCNLPLEEVSKHLPGKPQPKQLEGQGEWNWRYQGRGFEMDVAVSAEGLRKHRWIVATDLLTGRFEGPETRVCDGRLAVRTTFVRASADSDETLTITVAEQQTVEVPAVGAVDVLLPAGRSQSTEIQISREYGQAFSAEVPHGPIPHHQIVIVHDDRVEIGDYVPGEARIEPDSAGRSQPPGRTTSAVERL